MKKAMRAYPDDVTAHYYYAKSFLKRDDKPSKQAIVSARSAIHYYRDVDFLKNNLDMAMVLEKAGEAKRALPVYERIAIWGPNSSIRYMARQKIKEIQGL